MIHVNDGLRADCNRRSRRLLRCCRHRGLDGEHSRRREGKGLELGLSKYEVIAVDRERKVIRDTVFYSLQSPNEPSRICRRIHLRPEDLAGEERLRDFLNWDDPSNRTEQYDVDNSAEEEKSHHRAS